MIKSPEVYLLHQPEKNEQRSTLFHKLTFALIIILLVLANHQKALNQFLLLLAA